MSTKKQIEKAERLANLTYKVLIVILLTFVGFITFELQLFQSIVGAILVGVLYFSLDSRITALTGVKK